MNKTDMLVKRIKEFSDKDKREVVWQLLDKQVKKSIETLINDLGVKFNE